MDGNRIASRVMFWLGVGFMSLVVFSMTPLTYQLDDIKVTFLHVLGPFCVIVYFFLVSRGLLEFPRKGTAVLLGLFFFSLVLSTLLTASFARWQGWLGIWMQYALLGPFFAFFAAASHAPNLKRVLVFFTLMAFGTCLVGIAVYGVKRVETNPVRYRYGIASWYKQNMEKEVNELSRMRGERVVEYQKLEEELGTNPEPMRQATIQARMRDLYQRVNFLDGRINEIAARRMSSSLYRLASTFDGVGAQNNMMSVVLNRNFYASFLLLMLSLSIGVFLTSGDWFMSLLRTGRVSHLWSRSFLLQMTALATILASIYSIIATGSKVSIFAGLIFSFSLIFIMYFFLLRREWRHRIRLLVLCLAMLFLVIPAMLMLFKPDVGFKVFDPDFHNWLDERLYVSFTSRSIIWGGALEIIKEFPFFGGGPMSFGIWFPYHRVPSYFLYEISHRTIFAHNYFLDSLAETGLFGFSILMSFLGFLFWKCLVLVRRDPNPIRGTLVLCLVAGVAGFFLNSLTCPNSRWPIGAVNLWAMLGIMAGAINAPRLRDGSGARREFVAPGERQRKIALALCVLSILCFIKTSHYGVNYFRAAIVNNNGLNLTGETGGADTVAGHQGVLQLVRESAQYGRLPLSARGEHIAQLESALRSMNLTNDNNRLIYSILDIMRQPATLDKANLDLLQSEIKRVEANYEQLRLGAIKAFEDAIRLNPYFTTSYYKLATLYFYGPRLNPGREDYLAALEMYRRLQKMGPEYSQVRLNLGATFLNLGDFERAVRQYRLAARMSVDVLEMNPTRLFIINLQRVAAQRKSPLLSVYDIENAAELARRLMKPRSPLEKRLAESLGEETKNGLKIIVGSGATNIIDYEDNLNEEKMGKSPKRQEELKERFLAVRGALEKMVEDLNKALNGPELYDAEAFRKITLSPSTLERHKVQERMKREPGNTHLVRLNRMLLCDAFSGDLALPPAEEAARVAWRQVEWWERIYSDDKPIRWTEKTRESEVRETAARMWYQAARAGASYPEQVRAFRHLWSLTSQPESLLPMLFELCVEYQDPASLASFCSELLKTEPSNASLHLYLALAEVEMGRPREAKRHALIVKNLEPGGVEHRYVLHLVYKKAGMAEQAKLEAEEYAKAGRNALWVNEARLHTQGIDMRGANPDNVVIVDDATTVPRP